MFHEIDAQLKKIVQAGETPRTIEVGVETYSRLYNQAKANSRGVLAAPVLDPNEKAPINNQVNLSSYKGIKLVRRTDVDPQYLKVIAEATKD